MERTVRSASLVVAIILAVVVVLTCAAVITTHALSSKLADRWFEDLTLENNARSGIALASKYPKYFSDGQNSEIDLFGDGRDSVRLHTYRWGAYIVASSIAFRNSERVVVTCFLGSEYPSKGMCFWMMDRGRPLAVSGRTSLTGEVSLPRSGAKRVSIEGAPMPSENFIMGDKRTSGTTWSSTGIADMAYYRSLLTGVAFSENAKEDYSGSEKGLLIRSFTEETMVVVVEKGERVEGKRYDGPVILWGAEEVTIGKDVILNGAMVIAPRIKVETTSSIQAQFIASKEIVIGSNVELAYPSALILTGDGEDSTKVVLSMGSRLEGDVLVHTPSNGARSISLVLVDRESIVVGQVNTPGVVEIRGEVHGGVRCGGTIVHGRSAIYDDHLLDAVIDGTLRPVGQIGYFDETMGTSTRVIQWHD